MTTTVQTKSQQTRRATKPWRKGWLLWGTIGLLLIAIPIAVTFYFPDSVKVFHSEPKTDTPTSTAKITTLLDKVVEQGEIESQATTNCVCETDSYENKIIFLAPEGKLVSKDEVLVKFDPSKITERIEERKAQINQAKAETETAEQELKVQEDEIIISLQTAELELKIADLDLKKYQEGDYLVNKSEIEGNISEAQTDVDKARRDSENMRTLVKRGFREYEQLREAEQIVQSTELRLKNAKQKLESLENFEHVKSLAEFEGKAEEAKIKLDIARTTAAAQLAKADDRLSNQKRGLKLKTESLKRLQEELAKHEIRAPQAGTLTYAKQRYRENRAKVHEGSIVDQSQVVVILPDMTRMQVKVGVHETMISKVKVGQSALIRVDAFSGESLTGLVQSVSDLSTSTPWERTRDYHVIVTIDSFPAEMKIKPGMTAEVEILAGQYKDVLAVPIQAVTNFGRDKYVFIESADKEFKVQKVTTGRSNLSFVEIKAGIKTGQNVALDAYQRGLIEFEGLEPNEETPVEPTEQKPEVEKEELAADQEVVSEQEKPATQTDPPKASQESPSDHSPGEPELVAPSP